MKDKITPEQAIQHLKNVYACGRAEPNKCLDTKCDKCEYHTDPNIEDEVYRMAIEALEKNEKLKAVIKGWYGQNGIAGVDEEVNAVSCSYCTRRIDGECPLPDDLDATCPQSDDEAIELFFKYGLE